MVRGLLLSRRGSPWPRQLGAATLTVRVVDPSGRPVRDAVVTLYPSAGARAPRPGGRFVVSQQNLQFHPFLTIVPVGADVSFPNLDNTKHHVYSFSPAKRFELKLFAKDQSRTVHFDKPGVVALGCNIHDQMSAFIVVADSAWTARTNAQGMRHLQRRPEPPGRRHCLASLSSRARRHRAAAAFGRPAQRELLGPAASAAAGDADGLLSACARSAR